MKTIINGLVKENAIFSLLLGLCSALALTNKVESAYMMGFCVLIVLLFSNLVISLIRKLVPNNVRIPVYILIIGTFVTILEILLKNYIPNLYQVMGIYLPLIVVNCLVLGRALSFASKNGVKDSVLDAIGIGLGYTVAIVTIALFREVLGSNTITLIDSLSSLTGYKAVYTIYPSFSLLPFSIMKEPAGAFLTLGILMGLFKHYFVRGRDQDDLN